MLAIIAINATLAAIVFIAVIALHLRSIARPAATARVAPSPAVAARSEWRERRLAADAA
jgi:hypothetical protein